MISTICCLVVFFWFPVSIFGQSPTESPTKVPTEVPTEVPTIAPTKTPTQSPTNAPTAAPTEVPTKAPTNTPTVPSDGPICKFLKESFNSNIDGGDSGYTRIGCPNNDNTICSSIDTRYSKINGSCSNNHRLLSLVVNLPNQSIILGSFLGGLTSLTQLKFIGENCLSGTIPTQIGQLGSLIEFDATDSYISTPGRTIPTEIGSMSSLNIFKCGNCHLVGTIPTQVNSLTSLSYFDVQNSLLTFPFPKFTQSLKNFFFGCGINKGENLQLSVQWNSQWKFNQLSLRGCGFKGIIPAFGLENNAIVDLSGNSFTSSLMNWTTATGISVNLRDNSISGTIPTLNIKTLDLTGNQFGGTFPSMTGNPTKILLGGNRFSLFTLPANSGSLTELDLGYNSLTSLPNVFNPASFPVLNKISLNFNKIRGNWDTSVKFFKNFAGGFIDISNNFIEGSFLLSFEDSPSPLNPFVYKVLAQNNRLTRPVDGFYSSLLNSQILLTFNPQDINECADGQNGGCSQACDGWTPMFSFTCSCNVGYYLQNDSKSCKPLCGDSIIIPPETCDPPGIGCTSSCRKDVNYNCPSPNNCTPICGNGVVTPPETCDLGNAANISFGCSATCQVTKGYICEGQPSICNTICGDGLVVKPEQCDTKSLGCTDCQELPGYNCSNNTCSAKCGDNYVVPPEDCDNVFGCANCKAEKGYICNASSNNCTNICGDGIVVPPEICDNPNPGCHLCRNVTGYTCANNVCTNFCGDGEVVFPEECDNPDPGCNKNCTIAEGYLCPKNNCSNICGDGKVVFPEDCDNVKPGCVACKQQLGYSCNNVTNECNNICGDKIVVFPEECDINHSGCVNCKVQEGYICPDNNCRSICGDGIRVDPEICDNLLPGCINCQNQTGYTCEKLLNKCTNICGDNFLVIPEECDNQQHGCLANCTIATGYTCPFNNCSAICGDGLVVLPEECDNQDLGCQNCKQRKGYICNASLNTCINYCGDFEIVQPEECDTNATGCNKNCTVQKGYSCPNNICTNICGDGIKVPPEECDIFDFGCEKCKVVEGYECFPNNTCKNICGDGKKVPPEECDTTEGCINCKTDAGYNCFNNKCYAVCGDGLVVPPEICDTPAYGCFNCTALKGYECFSNNTCKNICGDGFLVEPEECDGAPVGCINETCTTAPGYKCVKNNSCTNVCGDGLVVPPEVCDTLQLGCKNCQVEPGYSCVDNVCSNICGDGVIVKGEQCDTGATKDNGCYFCQVTAGFYCPKANESCHVCKTATTFVQATNYSNIPFPSIKNYLPLLNLNLTTFLSCTACQGIQLYYSKINDDNCSGSSLPIDEVANSIQTRSCSFPCVNSTRYTDARFGLPFLLDQFQTSDFLSQILSQIFYTSFKGTITQKRAYSSVDLKFTNCSIFRNKNVSDELMNVIYGLAHDILPSLPNFVITPKYDPETPEECGAIMTSTDPNTDIPIPAIVMIVIVSIAILLALVISFNLWKYYSSSLLHHLPKEVSWSFLDQLTHPWSWTYIGSSTNGYYMKEYERNSVEWKKVQLLVDNFLGGRKLPITKIIACYNPSLASSFINQWNIMTTRKKFSPEQFFNQTYLENPQKVWVAEQFKKRANLCSYNLDLAVPIIPSVHGTDFFIAEKIAQTGFANISILDEGYFGKGIYFSTYMLYTLPYCAVKASPAIIISYLNMGNVYPVTEHHRAPDSLSGKAITTGYNSHYIRTTNEGICYQPTEQQLESLKANGLEPKYLCDEIVLPQESQILPAFILSLEKKTVLLEAKNWARETYQEQLRRESIDHNLSRDELHINFDSSISTEIIGDGIDLSQSEQFTSDDDVKEFKSPFSFEMKNNKKSDRHEYV